MKTGSKVLIIIIIIIALAAMAYVIYKVMQKPQTQQQNPNTLPNTGYTGGDSNSGSGSGNSNPPPPPPPPTPQDNIGKVAVAKNLAVDVYYQHPFSLYKTTTYVGEYIGTVTGVSGMYYVINDGQSTAKLVMQQYVNFL